MDELAFAREKLRREAQELANTLDAATAHAGEDDGRWDMIASARTITTGAAAREYIDAVLATIQTKEKEDQDAHDG